MIKNKFIGKIELMKNMNIKPNFSELARQYGVDRHTIAKYYHQEKRIPVKRNKESYLYPYLDEIKQKADLCRCTKKALFQYFQNKYGVEEFKCYNTFTYFTRKHDICTSDHSEKPKLRYETEPGDQLQVDWKESIKMKRKDSTVIQFELFAATFSYSRYHFFLYSRSKTTEDFLRCLIDVLYMSGGMPKRILTDNMTAVVSINNGTRQKHPIIKQFESDIGIHIQLCKVRHPYTKGKVESSNRFVEWLKPYDGELESEGELIEVIKKFNQQINEETNQTTGIPPVVLMKKEIEHLQPIPNKILMDTYIQDVNVQKVPETLLVTYKGHGYSVSKKLMGKRVKLVPVANQLYIYFNTKLQCVHKISSSKFNYKKDHYCEALRSTVKGGSDKEIEKRAEQNLALLDKIGG